MPLSFKIIKKKAISENEEFISIPTRDIKLNKSSQKKEVHNEAGEKLLKSAQKQAKDIIYNAEENAKKILEETNQKIREVEKEASEKGYTEGYEKGEKTAWENVKKETASLYEAARDVLSQAENIRKEIYKTTEKELLELSISIAEKLFCKQIEVAPETITEIVKNACQEKMNSKMFTIYANPDFVNLIKTKKETIISELDSKARIQVVSDSSLGSGSCRIENETGFVDATLETMLKNLRAMLGGES